MILFIKVHFHTVSKDTNKQTNKQKIAMREVKTTPRGWSAQPPDWTIAMQRCMG